MKQAFATSITVCALIAAGQAQSIMQSGTTRAPSASRQWNGPSTWYVDVNATPPGAGSQASPYASIQYALARPTTIDGDRVLVLPGTYLENVDFLGKDVRVVSTNGAAATIVDASGVGTAVTFATGEGAGAVLDGFTLRNGRGTGSEPDIVGGGVRCVGASPTLRNLIVRENKALRGSGLYFESSAAHVEACTIEENTALSACCGCACNDTDCCGPWSFGIGVFAACDADVLFEGCSIRSNRVTMASVSGGGGVFGGGTYVQCTIEGNTAFAGAGVHGGLCNPELIDCTIRDNWTASVTLDASAGGGVFGPATLSGCTISGNTARFNGGGVWEATLTGCTIFGNTVGFPPLTSTAGNGGGAAASVLVDCDVYDNVALGAHPTFVPGKGGGIGGGTATRCRIWNNTADLGGGTSNTNLERCTVYGNSATAGGGVGLVFGSAVNVRNTILYGNSTPEVAIVSGTANVTYSNVQGGYSGTGNIATHPQFVSAATGDFHLLPSSPCIDAGDPTTFDPDGSRADMGALPFGASLAAASNGDGESGPCTPAATVLGTPSFSGADDLRVTCSGVSEASIGVLMWWLPSEAVPFAQHDERARVRRVRVTPQHVVAATGVSRCPGQLEFKFSHEYLTTHGVRPFETISARWYVRSGLRSSAADVVTSNEVSFVVLP